MKGHPMYFCDIHFIAKTKRKTIERFDQTSIVFKDDEIEPLDLDSVIRRMTYRYLVTPTKGVEKVLEQYEISLSYTKIHSQGNTLWRKDH